VRRRKHPIGSLVVSLVVKSLSAQNALREHEANESFAPGLLQRRRWDLNPRTLSGHTISNRADSAALAPLQVARDAIVALAGAVARSSRVLRNGRP
jgi:hypothetical protein